MAKKVENNNLYFLKAHPRRLLLFFIPFAFFMIVLGNYALQNKVILPGFYQFENQEALKKPEQGNGCHKKRNPSS